MSTHVEWIDATHPFFDVTLRRRGEPWDGESESEDDAIPTEVGLVLADDDAVVLCGTPADLVRVLTRAINEIAAHNAHAKTKEK